ncbi:MAG: Methylase involved in ubiquinone/menaquinone biosynthesis [Rhodobacteraceae bacterium HLUCCA08]|nr:MAG: Methylase involved in ubiquinone/menaquinone biosynthesis [Rhodobacteraceae bacterium HLUCCA08]
MSGVRDQYEAYPYPARDPADEAARLITGSPSDPREMDHFLWQGRRDWSRPLRALVAGGGTGDGLIQLAQKLAWAGVACDITYVDLSGAARAVAEARAAARGLQGITFVTGSLLEAPGLGRFDYIDCCGVLHHLPDPAEGFAALRAALAPGGGMGFMVYAPHGRSGVYPLQEAFGALFEGLAPHQRLARARAVMAKLPAGHPFRRNPNLGDHLASDAGFYDLLLHSQDRAFAVEELLALLAATGWALAGFAQGGLYDLARLAEVPEGMEAARAMGLAERLRGTLKVHVGYAVAAGAGDSIARPADRALVPHLAGGAAARVAQAVASGQPLPVKLAGTREALVLPRKAAPLIAAIDGRRALGAIEARSGLDRIGFGALWAAVDRTLTPWGLLHYSGLRA